MAAQDDFDLFSQVAEMLGLDEGESENFITSAMRRRGHRPSVNWTDAEGEGNQGGGDFFSRKREQRQVQKRPERKASGWQYE